MTNRSIIFLLVTVALTACDGAVAPPDAGPPQREPPQQNTPIDNADLDAQLRLLINRHGLTGNPAAGRQLPTIDAPLAQLGKKLFFTKALSGNFDVACVSCHHPVRGGGDGLSLPVGIAAIDPDLIGPGRSSISGLPNIPRNSPTIFNVGLFDAGLFADSRVASLGMEVGANGASSGISTPDSGIFVIDVEAGPNLVAAQSRFPVTSVEEMRGDLLGGQDNSSLREHLVARLGGIPGAPGDVTERNWLGEFQRAFVSSASAAILLSYDNIALALSEYERSQVFINNPWRSYVEGDTGAISADAKRGAILFYTDVSDGGGSCVQCHSGDLFSDEQHHAIGAPQFGPGKGNPGNHDFGRENITSDALDRFRFRTPSLLNISVTAPYMHTGAYDSLQQVMRHYNNPRDTVDDFFDDGGWCDLQQFELEADCQSYYPNARANSFQALDKVATEQDDNDPAGLPNANLNNQDRNHLVEFLQSLTDPCVLSRNCLAPWIADEDDAADGHQLNAVDVNGNRL